jgi:hypothetical protein
MKPIITSDNFVWKPLTAKQAVRLFKAECIELYAINEDESETLIESIYDLVTAIQYGMIIALEVGRTK